MRDFFEYFVLPIGGAILVIMGIIGLIILCFLPFLWNSAKVEARLYNQKFGTSYTSSDFFWAGDTVKSYVNKGEQKTFNLNLDN